MTTRFPTTTHTAGTTYSRAGMYALPAGDWSATATVKTAGGTLVQALAVNLSELGSPDVDGNTHALSVLATAVETATWPLQQLLCDIIFTDASVTPVKVPAVTVAINVSAHTPPLSDADNPLQVITPDMAPVLRGETGPAYPSEAAQAATEAAQAATEAARDAAIAAQGDAEAAAMAAGLDADATASDRIATAADRDAAAASALVSGGHENQTTLDAAATAADRAAAAASAAAALDSQNDIHNNWQAKLDAAAAQAAAATTQAGVSTTQAGISTAQAATATAQALISTTQAGTATAQAVLAAAARTAAEAARDAAQLSAGVYASTVAGLAATTTGHYFSVPASGSDVYLTLYLNSAGVAVYVNTYPALSAVDMFAKQESAIDDDVQRVVIDAKGFAGAKLTSRGWLPRIPVDRPEPVINNELQHILGYGQSLAGGWNAKPIITGAAVDDCFMFNGGVNTAEVSETPAVSMASLSAYLEQLQGATYGESPFGGFSNAMAGMYRDEHGKALSDAGLRLLFSNAGKDGAYISSLSKPSTYYTRILNQVTAGKALATAAGYNYRLAAFFWTQGEYDSATAVATYLSALQTLRSNLQTDIRAITGGSETVRCIHYQTWYNSVLSAPGTQPGSSLAQLAAHEADPDKFILATPIYFMNTIDSTHMRPETSAWIGAYYALAYKRVVLEGRRWNPVRPLSLSVSGAVITVRFAIQGTKLLFDTKQVMAAASYGFAAYTAAGAALTITSVQIVGTDKVQITLSAAPSAGDRLRYCDTSSQDNLPGFIGPRRLINGARGNLRDNAGDTLKFRHSAGYVFPMHNWCVAFDKVIA